MLLNECKGCRWCAWMIGIGQGVRCSHPEHRRVGYDGNRAPTINEVHECKFYQTQAKK